MATECFPNLYDLNEDCLLHLFSYLPLTDQIKCCLISPDFIEIAAKKLQTEPLRTSACRQNFTLDESVKILDSIGYLIKHLNIDEWINESNIDFYKLLPDRCTNLTAVEFYYPSTDGIEIYRQLLKKSKQIEFLRIDKYRNDLNYHRYDRLEIEVCTLLQDLPNLQRLRFTELYDLEGENFHLLKNLVELNVEYCSNFAKEEFMNLFRSIKLQKLNINGCFLVDREVLELMVGTQTELEDAIVCNIFPDGLEIVGELKRLKHLTCFEYIVGSILDDFIAVVVKHHADDLETLRILSDAPRNLVGFREEILAFKNLEELYLPFDKYLEDDYLDKIIARLPKLKKLRLFINDKPLLTDQGIFAITTRLELLKKIILYPGYDFETDLLNRIADKRQEYGYGMLTIYIGDDTVTDDLKDSEYSGRKSNVLRIVKITPNYQIHVRRTQRSIGKTYKDVSSGLSLISTQL